MFEETLFFQMSKWFQPALRLWYISMETQVYKLRQREAQKDGETYEQADGLTDRQTDGQINRQTVIQTDR